MLSIKGNGNVLLKLALTCRLWTESYLPSLKGNKATDTLSCNKRDGRSEHVINTRPKPQLTDIQAPYYLFQLIICAWAKLLVSCNKPQAASNKRLTL